MNVHGNVQMGVRGVHAGLKPVTTRRANRQDKALSELLIRVNSITNTAGRKPVLKVGIPVWFQIVCGIGGIVVEVLLCFVLLQLWQHQSVDAFVPKGSVILFIIAMGCYAIRLVFSVVYADDFGVELCSFMGTKRKILWKDIRTVTVPRFGIPYDFVYIVSRKGIRIPLAREVPGYNDLLDLIQSKSLNLEPKELPTNLRSRKSAAKI